MCILEHSDNFISSKQSYMQKLILLFLSALTCSALFAQKSTFQKEWKKIDSLEQKGLSRSAREEAGKIFILATGEKNQAQQIKCIMYELKSIYQLDENKAESGLAYFDSVLNILPAPAHNIVLSMKATALLKYLNNNRYYLYQRTELTEEKDENFTTWSIAKLQQTIGNLFLSSLKDEELLKNTPITAFEAILTEQQNTLTLRPTLYDFLTFRALEYFQSSERDLIRPAHRFTINTPDAFLPAENFTHTTFTGTDTISLQYNALQLYRNFLQFHLYDANKDALLDADLSRLQFVYYNSVLSNKTALYDNALLNLENTFPKSLAAAQAAYQRAILKQQAVTQGDSTGYIRAVAIARSIINSNVDSSETNKAKNLIATIEAPSYTVEAEKVNLPEKPFRISVSYQNTNQLFYKIIPVSFSFLQKMENRYNKENWRELLKLKASFEGNIRLTTEKDYRQHRAEIKIDALNAGQYLLVTSLKPGFSMGDNLMSAQVIYVSNLAYFNNYSGDVFVVNRGTGAPLEGASVQAYEKQYSYKLQRYEYIPKEKYITGKDGSVKLKTQKSYQSLYFEIKYKDENFFLQNESPVSYYGKTNKKPEQKLFLFTDRSIYRPGQPVYYKGICLIKDTAIQNSKVVANTKITLNLYDANGSKIDSATHTTNAYGSINGKFTLPEGLLTGRFSIQDSKNLVYYTFSVEEYKRPKFEVSLDAPKESYRLKDTISIAGTAKAFAGNTIANAKVTYRVTRNTSFPYWRMSYYRFFPPVENNTEITYGESLTDNAGNFVITFPAIPDESVPKESEPTFIFTVYADITDLNGETRSGNIIIPVSYQALQIHSSLEGKIITDSLPFVKINTQNIIGEFEQSTVTVDLIELKKPQKIFRSRYWQQPDRFLYTPAEYSAWFPNDIYFNENEPQHWPQGKTVFTRTDTTSFSGKWNWQKFTLTAGWYKLTIKATDKYGEPVNFESYFEATNPKLPTQEAFTFTKYSNVAQPGQKIQYTLSTGYDKIWLLNTTAAGKETPIKKWIELNNKKIFTESFEVKEKDRGRVSVDYVFVKNNNFYSGTDFFSIPWTNKELSIQLGTYRNKVLPNTEEKWSIKISGEQQEKFAAEALISMYDASLDQFTAHSWSSIKAIWPSQPANNFWRGAGFSQAQPFWLDTHQPLLLNFLSKVYYQLQSSNWQYVLSDNNFRYDYVGARSELQDVIATAPLAKAKRINDGNAAFEAPAQTEANAANFTPPSVIKNEEVRELDSIETSASQNQGEGAIQIRKDFRETAFFFPDLQTDSLGNISFSFTTPEALTKWKLMAMAHTKSLSSGYLEAFTITQKPLMVQPNLPRFLREGDRMELEAKVVNMDTIPMIGTIQLQWIDEITGSAVDGWFNNIMPIQYFSVEPGQSQAINFPFVIPQQFNGAVKYRIVAITSNGAFSDGEEAVLPVLTNRTLVTETLPINMRGEKTKDFTFKKLLSANNSSTLSHQSITVEYTSNPAWYAVQAIPYLMEYPYECTEQTFNRYYANMLASFIINRTPRIKEIFSRWSQSDTSALISNLQKNQELKTVLLEETPWVIQGISESEQKQRISLLFNLANLSKQQTKALDNLFSLLTPNGGFSWFKGGREDRFITQYILTGMGKLRDLGALENIPTKVKLIIAKAVPYLDNQIVQEYNYLIKEKINLSNDNLSYTALQYLYMRSFFTEIKMTPQTKKVANYYLKQAQKYWVGRPILLQGMIAVTLNKNNEQETANDIIRSLRENAIINPELGGYWRNNAGGYFWYQAPIESQSMAIEAFSVVTPGNPFINDLKTWLLKNKQTNNWRTTKATADACYALLMQGGQWLTNENDVTIQLGSQTFKSSDEKTEAGTGYFKTVVPGNKVQQGMGNIRVTITPKKENTNNTLPSWGAVYWQYFEDMDKITPAATPLSLSKKIYIERNTDRGPILEEVKAGDEIKVGDKMIIRLHLKCDRDMEYIHLKDMRASGTEPVNVMSGYKYQGGLFYYESTRDASTNFFFDRMPKGSYIFEYPEFATHAGDFSSGIAVIQSMYAPEYTSHSEGVRINIVPTNP